jgi:sigma-B regulation protein RsbU (phosphoserine phosphatase)
MPISKRKDLMYQVMENMTGMIRVIDIDNNVIYMNKSMREEFGDSTGDKCHEMLCQGKKCEFCIGLNAIAEESPRSKEIIHRDKIYRVIASPATDSSDEKYSIEIFYDITEQKKLEEESKLHYEKLKGDLEFAKQVQRKALPENRVYENAIKTYSAYSPSEDLGGDIFDIVKLNDELISFYIADVSGHGVRSSLMTIFLRQVIRGMKEAAADPIGVLDEILKDYRDLDLDREQYISMIYGVYNIKTRGLSIVNAGHNCLPLVIENKNDDKLKLTEMDIKGMPICSLIASPTHKILNLQMEKGDRILLYTDGITEAFNKKENKEFGLEGLKKTILGLREKDSKGLVQGVIKKAKNYASQPNTDDMAILILELLKIIADNILDAFISQKISPVVFFGY